MTYSLTEQEYNKHLLQFKNVANENGLKYFNGNWACCEDKWVKFHRIGLKIRDNNTNNAVESLNNQFKRFVGINQRISVCLTRIFAYLSFLYNKYEYKSIISKTKSSRFNANFNDPIINKFFDFTNKKNAEWLSLQFELSKLNYEVNYFYSDATETIDQLQSATIKTKNNIYTIKNITTNTPSCSCYQMQTMNLPCRHIFKCRSDMKLKIFEPEMIKNKSNNDEMIEVDASSDSETVKTICNLNTHKKSNNLTVKEKYNLAWAPIKELASALSHLNNEDFDEQFSLVLEVKTFIENKMKFKIVQLSNNNDSINEDVQVDDINVEETVVPVGKSQQEIRIGETSFHNEPF
jgi:hypothetical protein